MQSRSGGKLSGLPPAARWALLAILTMPIAGLFHLVGLPAALLLGAMVAGIVMGTNGGGMRMPRFVFIVSQALIGCVVASSITAEIVQAFAEDWHLLLGVVVLVIASATFLGWLLTRMGVMPGTTGVWGSFPGAASTMMLMAEIYGADARLVAFMQYLRVVMVAAAAAIVARIWTGHPVEAPGAPGWLDPFDVIAVAKTLLMAAATTWIGFRLRLPGAALLCPMVVGAVLHASGTMPIVIPPWLAGLAFVGLGWRIGVDFTREILMHALRALPQVVCSILVLMAFAGLLAWILVAWVGIDPLTAYLATSPGGMDVVAVIAASSPTVDISFVMALQCLRFVIVLLTGPWLAKQVADRITARSSTSRGG